MNMKNKKNNVNHSRTSLQALFHACFIRALLLVSTVLLAHMAIQICTSTIIDADVSIAIPTSWGEQKATELRRARLLVRIYSLLLLARIFWPFRKNLQPNLKAKYCLTRVPHTVRYQLLIMSTT